MIGCKVGSLPYSFPLKLSHHYGTSCTASTHRSDWQDTNSSLSKWVGKATLIPQSLRDRQGGWHAGILCFMYGNCRSSEVWSQCTVRRWMKLVIGPTGRGLSLGSGRRWLSNTLLLLQRKNNRTPPTKINTVWAAGMQIATILAAWHGMMHHYLFWLHSMSSLAFTVSNPLNKGHYFRKDKRCINPFMLLSAG